MKKMLAACASFARRIGYLLRAAGLAAILGVIEMVQSKRGRRELGVLLIGGVAAALVVAQPIRAIGSDEAAVRVNRLTGGLTVMREGWAIVLPGLHEFRRYPLR